MKHIITITGIVLIATGVLLLSYEGLQYNKQEQIAKIGNVEITASTSKRLSFPPYLGGIAIVGGIIVLVLGGTRKK